MENDDLILKTFISRSSNELDLIKVRNKCERYCLGRRVCWGCSLSCQPQCTWNALEECHSITDKKGVVSEEVTQKPGI